VREPGKAAYLDLERDPELAFEYYLAEKLGRFVSEVREMDQAEFVTWSRVFARKAQDRQLAERMAAR
jgi:hypothetical protein